MTYFGSEFFFILGHVLSADSRTTRLSPFILCHVRPQIREQCVSPFILCHVLSPNSGTMLCRHSSCRTSVRRFANNALSPLTLCQVRPQIREQCVVAIHPMSRPSADSRTMRLSPFILCHVRPQIREQCVYRHSSYVTSVR